MNKRLAFLSGSVLFGLLLLLALTASVAGSWRPAATVRYVAPGGVCGAAIPCYATVQAAVDAAATGDEIRVAAGLYTGVSTRAGETHSVYLSLQ